MSLAFHVHAAELPTFNAVVASSSGEPVELAGAGWTGAPWPKGLYAKIADVASAPTDVALTPGLEASFARAGLAGSFLAHQRGSSRGVLVTRARDGVTFRVLALSSAADYALAVRLATGAARLAGATVRVEDALPAKADASAELSPDDLASRYDAESCDAHARQVGTWLVDDMAQERSYWFYGPRGWIELGPDDLGGVDKEHRFDRARAKLAGASVDDAPECPDARRKAVLLTAAMVFAAGADGRLDDREAHQLEAHFATIKELEGFPPRELLDAVRAEVKGIESLAELGSIALRRKAFVLASEVIASARGGELAGEAHDPNVQAVTALAKALAVDKDPVFVAQVVRTATAKYGGGGADVAPKLVLGMLLAAAADGRIDEREAAVLSALARTVPELSSGDVGGLFDAAKKTMEEGAERSFAELAALGDHKNKCFALAAEVALVAGRGPEGTLLPRLRARLAPEDDVAESAIATFAAKYA